MATALLTVRTTALGYPTRYRETPTEIEWETSVITVLTRGILTRSANVPCSHVGICMCPMEQLAEVLLRVKIHLVVS